MPSTGGDLFDGHPPLLAITLLRVNEEHVRSPRINEASVCESLMSIGPLRLANPLLDTVPADMLDPTKGSP